MVIRKGMNFHQIHGQSSKLFKELVGFGDAAERERTAAGVREFQCSRDAPDLFAGQRLRQFQSGIDHQNIRAIQ